MRPPRKRCVPGCGATSTRNGDQSIWGDVVSLGKPPQERNPVKQLESDFPEPGTNHDRPALSGKRSKLATDRRGAPLGDQARRCTPDRRRQEVSRTRDDGRVPPIRRHWKHGNPK
jgi:hypothetical protein